MLRERGLGSERLALAAQNFDLRGGSSQSRLPRPKTFFDNRFFIADQSGHLPT